MVHHIMVSVYAMLCRTLLTEVMGLQASEVSTRKKLTQRIHLALFLGLFGVFDAIGMYVSKYWLYLYIYRPRATAVYHICIYILSLIYVLLCISA